MGEYEHMSQCRVLLAHGAKRIPQANLDCTLLIHEEKAAPEVMWCLLAHSMCRSDCLTLFSQSKLTRMANTLEVLWQASDLLDAAKGMESSRPDQDRVLARVTGMLHDFTDSMSQNLVSRPTPKSMEFGVLKCRCEVECNCTSGPDITRGFLRPLGASAARQIPCDMQQSAGEVPRLHMASLEDKLQQIANKMRK